MRTRVTMIALAGQMALCARAQAQAPTGDRIVAEVATRSDSGGVRCLLFDRANGFPTRPGNALRNVYVRSAGRVARCVFDVPPGDYAIAVYHDENGNGRLDTGVFRIPTEGTGASNNARARFGPPSFESARFHYRGGGVGRVRIRVVY